MRIKLWDISWTGQRHNEREVGTCLGLITWTADRGYQIVKADVDGRTWNIFRGGVLVAVAEIGAVPEVPAGGGPTKSPIPFEQKVGRLEAYRHLLKKPAAFCFVGS